QVTQQVIMDAFWHTPQPLFDPLGFLHLTLGRAHEQVVKLGVQLPLEQRPRATCALCLVQQRASWWAHVGDSRLYHVRHGALRAKLLELGTRAVQRAASASDNTSAAALRWLGD